MSFGGKVIRTDATRSVILIRLIVGAVFLSEGIQKFLFSADLGVGRFVKIGIPAPMIIISVVLQLLALPLFLWGNNRKKRLRN